MIQKRKVFNFCVLFWIACGSNYASNGADPLTHLFGLDRKEFVKSINKEFPITQTGNVSVNNKYGTVRIRSWNQDLVKVTVQIVVKAASKEIADQCFQRIDVQFQPGNNSIQMKTNVSSRSSTLFAWTKKSNYDFSINYDILMPERATLALNNMYGDTHIADLDGKTNLQLSYGNMQLGSLMSPSNIQLRYGTGNAEHLENSNIQLSYSNLTVLAGKHLQCQSEHSVVHIQKASYFEIDGNYNEIHLGKIGDLKVGCDYSDIYSQNVESLEANTKYTDIELDDLSNKANAQMQYGTLDVKKMQRGFTKLDYDGNYSKVRVTRDINAPVIFVINGNYLDVDVSKEARIHRKQSFGTTQTLEGMLGNGTNKGLIRLVGNYNDFELR